MVFFPSMPNARAWSLYIFIVWSRQRSGHFPSSTQDMDAGFTELNLNLYHELSSDSATSILL